MIGQTISHYTILEKLGEGGMGIVYKAEDAKLKRTVALKFLPPELTRDAEAKERFIREAQAASAIQHNNICTIHDIDETDDRPAYTGVPAGRQLFIVMDCYEGESLKEKIARGQMKIEDAVDFALQVASGLSSAHEKGIVHRDIKPGNIIVTRDGSVKILDFGLAKLAGQAGMTKTCSTVGTAAYMSPEQIRGEDVDARTDIWSLGAVLFEMLTGQLPFRGDHEAAMLYSVVNENPREIATIRPDVPPELAAIVCRALEKHLKARYSSVGELLRDLTSYRETVQISGRGIVNIAQLMHRTRRPQFAIPLLLILIAVIAFGIWFFRHEAKVRWAKEELLPKINTIVEQGDYQRYPEAYSMAEQAEEYIQDDATLTKCFAKIAVRITIRTSPPGARVFEKQYQLAASDWQYLGISPLESLRVPAAIVMLRMEKEGYEPVLVASSTWNATTTSEEFTPTIVSRVMDRAGAIPFGMVRVCGVDSVRGVGPIADFYIDRYEVTNRMFQDFIDKGGYSKKEFWRFPFEENGRVLSWEAGMRKLVDQTGRPGPATWAAGDYPKGQDDYPVSGVSWYEAAAYAEYMKKTLPTSIHWGIAAGGYTNMASSWGFHSLMVQMSNFKGEGPAQVGSNPAITPYGAYDMAGNVREWCWNDAGAGKIIRGGAWNDATYMAGYLSQAPAFDRSSKNGFRCAVYVSPEKLPSAVFKPVTVAATSNFYKEKSASDPVFRVFKEQFSYDKSDLDPRIEWRNDSAASWIQEKITFNATYENERVIAYLFLPRNVVPPFQAVIYFPGTGSALQRSSVDIERYQEFEYNLSYLVKNGRAVLYPIYKGTFERGREDLRAIVLGDSSHQYTEFVRRIVWDLRRSIDYLETRPDIDIKRLAYLGISWGGRLAPINLAVDDRFKASVIVLGGIRANTRSEVNTLNYIPRVRIPTLMLNGRYDMTFPYETNSKPMFDLLGSPKDLKRQILYETDHYCPRIEMVKETLNWLDTYLGPVKR